ncbi:type VII secretion protein EccB [Mycolicibacterium vinylchloridicum]|uniref:type VII secretion protein EccB n=1 Tax=Mycolicibacterium vinylchloridicum TaxID=2736928 RepID=UPI0015CD1D68|nr:type VII secretion protein EccB [Mycolicibacterium vinylchloridicum]
MAGRPSLRTEMSAHRFLLRRLEYAVLGRQMPSRRDPLRAQKLSLLAGCGVATGMLILDVILGLSRHDRLPDDAALVMSRQSGTLFVRVDGVLRPVANLTSARLILGSPATPRLVDDAALRSVADGPTLGIPGAPRRLGEVTSPPDLLWAVCDSSDGLTTVAVGADAGPVALDSHAAVVVIVAHGDGAIYLLYDGKRAVIDPADPATARALHLDGAVVRTVSATLLNAIPEVPAIGPPPVAGMGQPSGIAGLPIGAVVRVNRTDAVEYFVVLAGGLQRVGRLAADLLRFADPAATEIADVAPELIAHSPLLDALPVATYPDEPPPLVQTGDELCATWQSGVSGIAAGPPVAAAPSITLAGSDGDGPGVDTVRMTPGRTLDVTEAGAAVRYLVTDAGVRFPVDDSAVTALGLTGSAAAPPAIVGALPAGPELAHDAASVGWDVLGSAP